MQTRTITSDPAVALELGRRLAATTRTPSSSARLSRMWNRMFNRHLLATRKKRL